MSNEMTNFMEYKFSRRSVVFVRGIGNLPKNFFPNFMHQMYLHIKFQTSFNFSL